MRRRATRSTNGVEASSRVAGRRRASPGCRVARARRRDLASAVLVVLACVLGMGPGCVRDGLADDGGQLAGLVNGSFELRRAEIPPNHIETLRPGSEELLGWEVVDSPIDVADSTRAHGKDGDADAPPYRWTVDWIGPTRWNASHGRHCLDLDGGVRQTVRTVVGQRYELRFDFAGNPELGPMVQTLRGLVDRRRQDLQFDSTGKSTSDLGWRTERILFTAERAETVVTFLNTRPNVHSAGVALDHVSLRALGPLESPPKGVESPPRPAEQPGLPPQGKEAPEALVQQLGQSLLRLDCLHDSMMAAAAPNEKVNQGGLALEVEFRKRGYLRGHWVRGSNRG